MRVSVCRLTRMVAGVALPRSVQAVLLESGLQPLFDNAGKPLSLVTSAMAAVPDEEAEHDGHSSDVLLQLIGFRATAGPDAAALSTQRPLDCSMQFFIFPNIHSPPLPLDDLGGHAYGFVTPASGDSWPAAVRVASWSGAHRCTVQRPLQRPSARGNCHPEAAAAVQQDDTGAHCSV